MNDPPRLLDPKSGAPLSRSLLRAGVDMGPPLGAKEQVWSSLSGALGVAAVVSAAPSATLPSSVGGSAGASAATHASTAAHASATSVGKVTAIKLIAGKWVLLSSLALVVAGGAAYRIFGSHPNSPSTVGVTAETQGNAPSDLSPAATTRDLPKVDATHTEAAVANVAGPSVDSGVATEKSGSGSAKPADRTVSIADASSVPSTRDGSARDRRVADAPNASPQNAVDLATPKDNSKGASTPPVALNDSSSGANSLVEESTALADARRKLNGGDSSGALQSLQAMDKRFGGGGLSQERTALLVQALAANGQHDAAARYADSFLASYPSSPFAPRVRPFATQ